MLFNTLQYGLFFVVVFALHWLMPQSWRRPFLLIASYYFYASAIPQYLVLILGLTVFNYALGLWLSRSAGRMRKALLWLGVAGNLASLAYFKYSGLLFSSLLGVLRHLPLMHPVTNDRFIFSVLLPLGISFFTFEFIHYIAEVYKGLRPMKNPVDFALFAAFFPTQIAGPIKRFPDFAKQLQHPERFRDIQLDAGVALILRGLLKKVLLADILAPVVAQMFSKPDALGWGTAWFAVFAFAAQIYGDFSGYTDIGRGCAKLLGYSVPENFDRPYQSASPAEFWHRWHMSLSNWLRDYLYFPLGGSRVAPGRIYVNLMITMALGGLWHGASWHYLVWGVYQGVLLCVHRAWERSVGKTSWYTRVMSFAPLDFLRRPCTLVFVCIGWVFFRADSVGGAFRMLHSMAALSRPMLEGFTLGRGSTPVLLMFGTAVVVVGGWTWAAYGPAATRLLRRLEWHGAAIWMRVANLWVIRPAFYTMAILLLVVWPPHAATRFIYFQF